MDNEKQPPIQLNLKERSWLMDHALVDLGHVLRWGMDFAAIEDNVFEDGYSDEFRRKLEELCFEEFNCALETCKAQAGGPWEKETYEICEKRLQDILEHSKEIRYYRRKSCAEVRP